MYKQLENTLMIQLSKLLKQQQAKVSEVLFVAVDGHGGSGKSTLADWLARQLRAEIVHTDDFASWDNPLDWWPLVTKYVFAPISKGEKVLNYPRSQWWANHNREPVVNQSVTKVMILEGVSSLRNEFRDYISLGIYVDTPKAICLQRGVARDLEFGKSKEEVVQMWEKYYAQEEQYMNRDQPLKFADIVIDGTKPFEEQIDI